MADDEVGVEPGRLAELASALENLRDVLAANVPIIVNTMEEYWNSGTGRPMNLIALKQAQARAAQDAADMRARSDLAQDWMNQAVNIDLASSGMATIPWDKADIDEADAQLQARRLAAAESSGDLAQVKAIQADIQDHLDDQDTAWLKVFYDQAAPQVANLASMLSRQDHASTVLLAPADQKILNAYASGLALLSRTNNLTQPVIARYTSAPDLWSVAMLVKYGPAGSGYGTSTSFAPGSTSKIQQGFLAQLTDAVYTATGNGTITMPLNWIATESTVSGMRAMPRLISEYDPLTAMLAADAQNKTAAGQVLAGPDGDAIAKTLEQAPFLTYLRDEDGGQPRLTSMGWSERTGPEIRTQLYDQQVVADFLTAATENPANVSGSPPRGDTALAWQAAQAAIRIVTNAPDPSSVVVSEPVRQAMLTTFGRYLPDMAIATNYDIGQASNVPKLEQGTYQLQLDGVDASGAVVTFEKQIEYIPKDAGTLQGMVLSALGSEFGLQAAGRDPYEKYSTNLAGDLAALYGQTITQQQNLHYGAAQAKDAADAEINTIIAMGEAAAGTISIGGTAVTAAKDALSISVPLIPQLPTDNASNQAAADLNAYAQDEQVLDIPMVQGLIKAGVVVPPAGANWYANGRIDPTGDYVTWWDEHKGLFIHDLPTTNDPPGKRLPVNPTNSLTMEEWRNTMGIANMNLILQMQTEEG